MPPPPPALKAFIESAPTGIAMFDREMRYVAVSPRWLADYRLTGELIGRSHYEVFPDTPDPWREVHRRALAGETLSAVEDPFPRADGSLQWVTWQARPWLHLDGSIGGIVIAAENVTAQRQDRELFRTLVDHLPELAWTARPDGHIDFYNRRWYEYTGTTAAEMEGWGWQTVHDPAVLPAVLERWQRSLATGAPFEMEFPLRGADGVFRWFLTRVAPLRDSAGQIIRWFGTNTNVDEARRANQKLQASERKFAAIFDRAPLAIGLSRLPEEVIVDVNPAFVALFGYAKEELIGKTSLDLALHLEPEARERIRDQFLRQGFVRGVESRLRTRSGEARVVINTIEAVELDGQLYALSTMEDVTERRHAEAELARASRRAEEANLAKDEFLAMLGHELRNPLAPIQTALQLMRLRASPAGERERAIIERQVQHMVRLVDDLLDVSRITRGQVALERARVDLAEVTARAIELASPLLEERRHRLTLALPPGLLVDGDADRLAQVVSNLLSNAAKYTPEGGEITIRGAREGERVALEVADSGVGIAPELLPRVFDLFVQGRQGLDRSQGGLGLGLAIVRRLVELHGGRVEAGSDALPRDPARGAGRRGAAPVRSRGDGLARAAAAPARPGRRRQPRRGRSAGRGSRGARLRHPGGLRRAERAQAGRRAAARGGAARHRPAGDGRLRAGAPAARSPRAGAADARRGDRLRPVGRPPEGAGGGLRSVAGQTS
jgi:PAS domain S-box-containing protein